VYDHLSRFDEVKLEQNEREIKHKLAIISGGIVQVTLRKCLYSVGFDRVPLDISRESTEDGFIDEGYINRYGTREEQQGAFEDYEVTDRVQLCYLVASDEQSLL